MSTLRDAWRHLWNETDAAVKTRLAQAFVCIVLSSALTAAAPLAFKLLIDALDSGKTKLAAASPFLFVIAYGGALWLARIAAELRTLTHGIGEQRLHRKLCVRVAAHAFCLPLHYHLSHPPGRVDKTLDQGLRGYEVILRHTLYTVLPVVIELAAVCAILLRLGHPLYLGILAASALAYGVIYSRGANRSGAAFREVAAARIDSGGLLTDGLSNIEPIKCFRALPWFLAMYEDHARQTEAYWRKFFLHRTATGQLAALVFAASIIGALSLAAREVTRGSMSLGDIVLIATYLARLTVPLEQLGQAARDLSQALAYLDRLLALLHETPEHDIARPSAAPPSAGHIEFRDVTFAYPGKSRPALRGVNFTIRAGSCVGIVGGSGSGKSTLARLLLRVYEPDSGYITLDGIALNAITRDDLSRCVVTVPQETVLLHTSIRNNITLGARVGEDELLRVIHLAQLETFIAEQPEGLETIVGQRGMFLSGGQRQRVVIARALLSRAPVVVCDEPTASLDSETAREVEPALRQLAAQQTTLMITHQLAAVRNADCIVVLDRGEVIEQGTHAELLLRSGRYARLVRAAQA